FSSRRRHTRSKRDWSSDVCSSDLDIRIVGFGYFSGSFHGLLTPSKDLYAEGPFGFAEIHFVHRPVGIADDGFGANKLSIYNISSLLAADRAKGRVGDVLHGDRKSTRLNSSHVSIS